MLGSTFTKKMKVEEQDLATRWGSGKARVFSTPAMIAFMELVSTEHLDKYIESENISVGTMVNIKHIRASKLGAEVICNTKIIEVKGLEIIFEVECLVDGKVIGSGTHGRYIVNKENFENKVYNN